VGIGTVLADNPRLTVRLVPGRSPLRVVTDSTLRIPAKMHLLTDGAADTLIATTTRASAERVGELERQGARVLVLEPGEDGRVDLARLLEHLRAEGVESLLVEGGGCLITSALGAGLVDRLVACIAPKVVGAGIDA